MAFPPTRKPTSSDQPIGLDRLSDDLVGSVKPPSLRDIIAGRVLTLFTFSLFATLGLVAVLAAVDITMIWTNVIEPDQRLVTQPVLMSMIGATIVELGAALTTIVLAVFRSPKRRPEAEEGPDQNDE